MNKPQIRKNRPSGLFLSPPDEVLWTKDEFFECTYIQLAEFFINWKIAIDIDTIEKWGVARKTFK